MKPPKRSGRPSVERGQATVSVTVRLSAAQYEKLCQQATVVRCSVPEHMRRLVTRRAFLES